MTPTNIQFEADPAPPAISCTNPSQISPASVGIEAGTDYETPSISEHDADLRAIALLRSLDGLSASAVKFVLRRTEFWLSAVTAVDCSATEFRRASAALQAFSEQSA